ncbi:MAG: bile acid germinant receptor pseudoprotease CspC [Peptostreptococcaceae bacterium]
MKKSYIVIYKGVPCELKENLEKYKIDKYIILNNQLATIYVNENFDIKTFRKIPCISWWEESKVISPLIQITDNIKQGQSVSSAVEIEYISKNPYLNISGKDTMIVIIDSGIDYLHPDFIKEDKTSKIISIWDQESTLKSPPEGYLFGSEFTNEDINKAIQENNSNLSKDTIGTGTLAAGLASGLGNLNSRYIGVAKDSELLIIKLKEYKDTYKDGIINYQMSDFLAGIKYAIEVQKKNKKMMIINITVGEQSRSFIETTLLDSFEELSGSGVTIVSGAGNEGNTAIHYQGKIEKSTTELDLIIQVGNQDNLDIVLTADQPDKIGAALISPSGELSYTIQYAPEYYIYNGRFNIENTLYSMQFIYPWLQSGTQELIIKLKNIKPGIWTLRLVPDFIINGRFDVYLPNRNLIDKDTRIIDPNSTSTITLMGNSKRVITVGAYNDKADSMWIGSSKGSLFNPEVKPDIVAPGVDIIGSFINNSYNTATGTGVSSSLTSGVLAILMEYINTQTVNSKLSLYTKVLKTYLMLGASKKEIYRYPNISQGYGNLDLKNTIIQISNNLE